MTATQTNEDEDKRVGTRKEKMMKVGSKAQKKQENRTQGVHTVTQFPVSATKPRRGLWHTICHLPDLVGNGFNLFGVDDL